ncbi:MAG TPA: hydroxymethylpyrimidine/phosphomethylpyrimidine kinase [Pyrinomonadaceae bacterium]|nr:hydroxymethylpyrimidine/phosphomethylpyrimidine kinase [Pyrinomonadaceae bacterium]
MKLARTSTALTIAGFDPSGGAGVLADVKTFVALGLRASAAVTSVTFQNSDKVFGAIHQTAEAVRAQVEPLLADFTVVCAKTGMLPTREIVSEVARLFRETDLPAPVVDPVIVSSSGYRLMEDDALAALLDQLLPLAHVVTPNIPEAERLTGIAIKSESDMRRAASMIRELGARAVLVKGGHLGRQKAEGRRQTAEGDGPDESTGHTEEAIDVLDDEGKVTVFRAKRIADAVLHGSGCILSAAIAAGLGKGLTLEESVEVAKKFVSEAFRESSYTASKPSG